MSGRVIGVTTALLLAPISAELLQAYLGDLGGPAGLAFLVVFLAPLYGGATLLIREVSLRTGRGWPGRLLLATAFGVAMPTLIDVSLFTPVRRDVDDWSTIFHAASFLGIGWLAVITWVGGHVLMSVGAPMVVAEGLSRSRGPWLGKVGLTVTALGFLALATLVHRDATSQYPVDAGPREYAVSAAVVAALVALALTRLGEPLADGEHRVPPVWGCLLVGVVAMAGFDVVPLSWPGLVQDLGVLVVGLAAVGWWSQSPRWTSRHVAALVFGALLARTLTGFLAPLPPGTTVAEKLSQSVVYLVVLLALGLALNHRTRPVPRTAPVPSRSGRAGAA